MTGLARFAALCAVVALPAIAEAKLSKTASDTPPPIPCRVVGVTDGDTLTALCPGNDRVKVRLAEIDAPEKKQAFGARSKESLSDMCFGKEAEITPQAKDRYGRTVARVICAGVDANAEQVRRGMAWVYDRYVTDRSLYRVQDEARAGRAGLWADPEPVRPWEWRKARRQNKDQVENPARKAGMRSRSGN